jgi:hypothetical protein
MDGGRCKYILFLGCFVHAAFRNDVNRLEQPIFSAHHVFCLFCLFHAFALFAFVFVFQDKNLKTVVSAKKKGDKKRNKNSSNSNSDNSEVKIDWSKVATSLDMLMEGRNATECKKRYEFLHSSKEFGRGPWAAEEDEKIVSMVSMFGTCRVGIHLCVCAFQKQFMCPFCSPLHSTLSFVCVYRRTQEMEHYSIRPHHEDGKAMPRKMAQSLEPRREQIQKVDRRGGQNYNQKSSQVWKQMGRNCKSASRSDG